MASLLLSGVGLYLALIGVVVTAGALLRSLPMDLYLSLSGIFLLTLGIWILNRELKSPTESREQTALTAQEVRERYH